MKKLIAILLAFAMILSMGVIAFAEGEDEEVAGMPKPNEVIEDNVTARKALVAFQDLFKVQVPIEYDEETGEPKPDSATMAQVDIPEECATYFSACVSSILANKDTADVAVPEETEVPAETFAEIKAIADKYAKGAAYLNKWDEEIGLGVSWYDAWLNYYGYKMAYMEISLDDIGGTISNLASYIVGDLMADFVAGNIDKETAVDVYGAIGYAIGELIAPMIGEDKISAAQVSEIVKKAIGVAGKVIPDKVEPADPMTSEEYAAKIIDLLNSEAEAADIIAEIANDVKAGAISVDQVPEIAKIIAESKDITADNETVDQILSFLEGLGGEGGFELPDFGDIELPWDNGNSEGGNFLDTILGIIGSIGDLIFGAGDDPDNNGGNGGNNDPWGGDNGEIPDTGDVSFVAVAAVAAVAGAALVLTRKKENDAE